MAPTDSDAALKFSVLGVAVLNRVLKKMRGEYGKEIDAKISEFLKK